MSLGKSRKRKMSAYKIEVIRRGTIIVDGVNSGEDAAEYIETCNPVDEVKWLDFVETVSCEEMEVF